MQDMMVAKLIEKYIMNPHLHSLILPNLVDRRKELKVTTLLLMNVVYQMKEMVISHLKWEFDSGITMIILCSPLYFL